MRELTMDDFDAATKTGTAVVDFWAPWCGPCKFFAPIFEATSKERSGILFAKVNVDEQPELAGRFGVRGIPTLVFLKDGKEAGRVSGAMPKPQFEKLLDQTLDAP